MCKNLVVVASPCCWIIHFATYALLELFVFTPVFLVVHLLWIIRVSEINEIVYLQ
jgi:hypothetical protein